MKNSYKFFLRQLALLVLLCSGTALVAQVTAPASYVYTTNTTSSLAVDANGNAIDMTTGTTVLVASAVDDGASAVNTIGFTFPFGSTNYTQYSASSNGLMGLGATAVSTGYATSGGTVASPRLAACNGDMSTASGNVTGKVVGTTPNRCLVVQWTNVALYFGNSTADATFQVRLYENGNIEYVYGKMVQGAGTESTYSTGFSNGTTLNSNFLSIIHSTNVINTATFSTNTFTVNTAVSSLNSTADGSRRMYRFAVPPACPAVPSVNTPVGGVATICSGGTAAFTVSGASVGTGITYQWEQSSDNVAFTSVTTGTGGTTIGYTTAALTTLLSYYRLKTTCSTSSFSYSPTFTVAAPTTSPAIPTLSAPVGGILNICPGNTAAMAATGASTTPGIAYLWEISSDAAFSVPTAGGTAVTYTSAALNTFPTYFRLKSTCGPTAPSYSATVTVNASAPPTAAASNVATSTTGVTSATITSTAGNGGYRLIYINTVNSFTDPLTGGLSTDLPTAATVYAGGQQLVYNNTGTNVTVTGLTGGTTYYVKVYEFLRCGAAAPYTQFYNTASPAVAISTKPALTYTVNRAANISYNSIFSTADTLIWSGTSTDDQLTRTTYIPFNFTFQGKAYNAFKVSTNGYITFDTVTTSSTAYGSLFTSTTYNAVIAPFSNDLVTPGNPGTRAGLNAAIRYKVQGTAPNRTVTIEFLGIEKFANPGPNLNFQIILTETTNVIQIVYGAMEFSSGGSNAAFAYALGLKGTGAAATPLPGEVLAQIEPNTTLFSNIGPATVNRGLGNLVTIPDCNSALIFTPSTTSPAFTVSAQNAPRNDEYTNATDLSAFIGTQPCTDFCGTFYSTQNATQSTQALPSATFGTNDDDVWFSFTPNNSVAHTLNVFGSNGYQVRAIVYNDPNNPTDTVVTGLATGVGLTTSLLMPNVQQGSTYYVRVYHNGAGGSGAIATATVTGGVVTAINIVNGGSGYTAAPTITFYGGNPTTAATATATVAGGAITGFTITAGGAGYVTTPSVYIPYTGAGAQPTVSMCLFETPIPPANDNASAAQALTVSTTCNNVTGNTLAATASPTANACAGFAPDDDVWYKFVMPSDGSSVTVNVQSVGSFNAAMEVMYGGPTANTAALRSIGCINNTSTGGLESAITNNFLPDSTYFVRVYHYATGAATGRFTICLVSSCAVVTSNAATTIGQDTARVSWSSTVGRFILEYGPAGFTPGTGATAGVGGTALTLNNVNSYLLTGLTANTTYDYYVRRFCSSTSIYTANTAIRSFTTLPPLCANPLGSSTTVTTATSICDSVNFVLSLGTTYIGSGITYQWQSSPNGTTWTNITGATSVTRIQQLTVGGDSTFRCAIICSAGSPTYSTPITVNRPRVCYCLVRKSFGSGSTGADGITNVTFANLNNSDNTFSQAYADFSSTVPPANVTAGSTVPLTFSVGPDGSQYYGVWIDYDQSGTFEASEIVAPRGLLGGSATANLSVTIPLTARSGITRLRVRAGDDLPIASDASACDGSNNGFGEAEDYAVNILVPIPIELQSFRAFAAEKFNTIEWITANERNTSLHIIERSSNGINNWVRIGERTAANNSNKPLNYTLNDNAPQCSGYYRLRTLDLDGKETISKSVSVERLCGEFSLTALFPNPTDESVTVRYEATQKEAVTITVSNLIGQVLNVQAVTSQDGFNDAAVNLAAYTSGTYFITLSNGTTKITQRVVKN